MARERQASVPAASARPMSRDMGARSQAVVRSEYVSRAVMLEVHDVGDASNQLQANGRHRMDGNQFLAKIL